MSRFTGLEIEPGHLPRTQNFLKNFVKRFSKYPTFDLDVNTDECADNEHDCDSNASCTNTEESFTCECNNGYTGDGKTCTEEIENEQGN